MNDILYRVAELFEVTVADLRGRSRIARIVQARFAAAYALHRHYPDMALSAIGAALGGRDHSTIINALRRAEDLARDDPDYRAKLHTLSSGLSPPHIQCTTKKRIAAHDSPASFVNCLNEGMVQSHFTDLHARALSRMKVRGVILEGRPPQTPPFHMSLHYGKRGI